VELISQSFVPKEVGHFIEARQVWIACRSEELYEEVLLGSRNVGSQEVINCLGLQHFPVQAVPRTETNRGKWYAKYREHRVLNGGLYAHRLIKFVEVHINHNGTYAGGHQNQQPNHPDVQIARD